MLSIEADCDCKRCDDRLVGSSRTESTHRINAPIVIALLFSATLPIGVLRSEESAEKPEKPVPTLSLEALFHPDQKYDFDGTLPATHWVGQSSPKLLIKSQKTWHEVDLNSGAQTPWPVVNQLAAQLGKLEGLKEDQARSAAVGAVSKLTKESDTVLVRIDKSLAVVSARSPARWLTRDASAWRNATLDPTARRVAYTRDGDLFVVDAKTDRSLQLTNDGKDTILDGVLDWTYQEEIFGRGNYRGFWFSPDGQWLAMLRIDISAIEPYVLSSASSQRGRGVTRRYPKAGDPIPHAGLYVWDLREFDSGKLPPAKLIATSTPQDERIITGVWWNPHQSALLFTVSDRLQTWRELRAIAAPFLTGTRQESSLLIREESPSWVEPPQSPGWLSRGGFLWRSDLPTGRTRLFDVSADGQVVTPVTPEDFDVRDFVVRKDGAFVMVTGDAERGTIERQAYRIDVKSKDSPQLLPITNEPGWHSLSVSPNGKWMVDRFSTTTEPTQLMLRSTQGNQRVVLAESKLKLLDEMIVPEVFQIPTPDGVPLPALLVRPKSATENKPSPVVIEVYGGPQSPVVSSRWAGTKALYRELLARRGIATLVVDNRSSAGRGIADTWSIRGRVGEVEFQDLMTAVDWLKKEPWVDSQRLAIRGWSFGGFLTLYAMTHSDAFAIGIAGGSVTDWKEYDAFYTERYMGLPRENEKGYQSTAPVLMADKLQGRVMLIHGESDDNVHPSGTMRMATALQKAGKDFRLMIYPGAAHHVGDPKQAWHMVRMTDRFLVDELTHQRGNSGKSRQ